MAAGLLVASLGRLFEDTGVFVGLVSFDLAVLRGIEEDTWAWSLYFAVLGFAAAWLIERQASGLRRAFVASCATLLVLDLILGGLRAWTLLGLLMVGWGGCKACIEAGETRVDDARA